MARQIELIWLFVSRARRPDRFDYGVRFVNAYNGVAYKLIRDATAAVTSRPWPPLAPSSCNAALDAITALRVYTANLHPCLTTLISNTPSYNTCASLRLLHVHKCIGSTSLGRSKDSWIFMYCTSVLLNRWWISVNVNWHLRSYKNVPELH